MIHITNSIFKAMITCPAAAMAQYEGRIKGDPSIVPSYTMDSTQAMAAGSLVDAIITRGYQADENDKSIKVDDFYAWLKSSYDDGQKNASLLVNKSGGWNAVAKKAINAANRLLEDSVVKDCLTIAETQVRISFLLDEETMFEGDIDILNLTENKTLQIIDLKSPGAMQEGWMVSGGKNVKVSWQESWAYWFQLSGYRYAFQSARSNALVNGKPLADTKYADAFAIDTGLLYTTREDVPAVGYIPIADYADVWRKIVKGRRVNGEISNLEAIKRIVSGEIKAPRCNAPTCNYCKAGMTVKFAPSSALDDALTCIDDIYDFINIAEDDVYANEY